jgi:hypothetical protein
MRQINDGRLNTFFIFMSVQYTQMIIVRKYIEILIKHSCY